MTRVGIVGAGITGLSLTHYLAERGVSSVTYEATSRPGGVIRSERIDGSVVEWGPQRLRASEPLQELIEALGLGSSVIEAPTDLPMYVYADGDLGRVPRSVTEFLRTDLLSWRGKLRVLAEPLTSGGTESETAATYFTRKFGREAYENVIGPLFGGIYASDPAEMPAEHALSGLRRLEAEHGSLLRVALDRLGGEGPPPISFDAGLQQLPRQLAAHHADRIVFDAPVSEIVRIGDRYRIDAETGTDTVDRVVVTTPADAAASLFDEIAPASASALRTLTYNPLALVALRSEVRPRGLGYQVRRDETLETLGVTWNASAFDRGGIFTAFLGGMGRQGLLERGDDELGSIARREFEAVLDAEASVLAVHRLERGFPAYDETWDALADVALPNDITLATNYTGRPGVPSRIRAARDLADSIARGRQKAPARRTE